MNHEEIAQAYTDKVLKRELARIKKAYPERLKEITDDLLSKFKEDQYNDCLKMIDAINDKRTCLEKLRRGAFHPSNKMYRWIFVLATGINLPRTVKDTWSIVENWIGTDWIVEHDRIENELRTRQESEKLAAKEKMQADRIRSLIESIGESIDGSALIELARYFELDVHPRTVHVIRNHVGEIRNGSTMTVYGKAQLSGVWSVFKQVLACVEDLSTPEPTEVGQRVFDSLFGLPCAV